MTMTMSILNQYSMMAKLLLNLESFEMYRICKVIRVSQLLVAWLNETSRVLLLIVI